MLWYHYHTTAGQRFSKLALSLALYNLVVNTGGAYRGQTLD